MLSKIVSLLFGLGWAACVFLAVFWLARLTRESRRTGLICAGVAALAFIAGVLTPFSLPNNVTPAQDAAAPAPSVSAPATTSSAASTPKSVDSLCGGGAQAANSAHTRGSIDLFEPGSRPGYLRLAGWSTLNGESGTAACVTIDGIVRRTTGEFSLDRPDVAAAFHVDSMRRSGFDLTVENVRGRHVIGIAVRGLDGKFYKVPVTRSTIPG